MPVRHGDPEEEPSALHPTPSRHAGCPAQSMTRVAHVPTPTPGHPQACPPKLPLMPSLPHSLPHSLHPLVLLNPQMLL